LPGCFSAGSTIEEAIKLAGEAIRVHLDMLLSDGADIPAAQPIQAHWDNPQYIDALFGRAEVPDPALDRECQSAYDKGAGMYRSALQQMAGCKAADVRFIDKGQL
jgi:hypothetical protein